MRPDLNKLLCERERRGGGLKYRNVRRSKIHDRTDDEGQPLATREGMTFRYGWDCKSFNENLNPLYHQVRKAVGRPWNKFFSELCKVFDRRSVINQHIMQHLDDFCVHKDLFIEDGEVWVRNSYKAHRLKESTSVEFYVDPRDGIIKRNKHYRRHWRPATVERPKTMHVVSDKLVFRKIGNLWFMFTLAPIPPKTEVFDVFERAFVSIDEKAPAWKRRKVYHVTKCSASKKDLKEYGLRETA